MLHTFRMTDPAREGTPPALSPALGQPDWKSPARSGQWARAEAAASLGRAPASSALGALSALQADLRARKYPAAARALGAYRQALDELERTSLGDAALLRSLAEPDLLAGAVAALEAGSGEADPAELSLKLRPAADHPLSRAEACNALGVLHALRGEPDAARAQFEAALASDPGHYRARMNLGNLALEAGQAAEAEAAYREVLRLAPDYEGAHHNLGVALRKQGKLYESVGAIRRAQRLGVRQGQQEAREEVREQLRRSPRLRLLRTALLVAVALLVIALIVLRRGGA